MRSGAKTILILVLIVGIVAGGLAVFASMQGENQWDNDNNVGAYKTQSVASQGAEDPAQLPFPQDEDEEPMPPIYEPMRVLLNMNPYTVGWIKIEGTPIDYPVVYMEGDNEYFLRHDYEGKEAICGTLYIDKQCSIWPRSDNLIIYGHNMRDGSMFSSLLNYRNKAYYREHPKFTYLSLFDMEEYEIVAVILSKVYYTHEDVFKYYKFFNARNADEFNNFVYNVKKMSLYDTGITPVYGDDLITLSTCEYSQEEGRLAVIARRIRASEQTVAPDATEMPLPTATPVAPTATPTAAPIPSGV